MAIPAPLTGAITAFRTAVKSAGKLEVATPQTLAALRNQAALVLSVTDVEIIAAIGTLDSADPSGAPPEIVDQFLNLAGYAEAQSALVDVRGYVGRAQVNLNQVQP